MSTLKLRIERLTDKLASVGRQGGDMTAELHKLASAEDLSANEIKRIAENANRMVQLQLYKVASDKRFKFALCDGKKVAEAASKTAADETKISSMMSAIEDIGGDPFAPVVRSDPSALSFMQSDVSGKVANAVADLNLAELHHKLAGARDTLEAVKTEAAAESVRISKIAAAAHDNMVQSSVDMVSAGITLPSLYDAMIAGASGSNSATSLEDATKQADDLMRLTIAGLKKRGIANHKMGFRHNGDVEGLEKLSADDLIKLCKYHSSYRHPQDLTMADVKTAELLKQADQYSEHYAGTKPGEGKLMRPDDALELLKGRATQKGEFAVPQAYLDDADPLPHGEPRVYDTNSELIISVRDLVGAQDRMRKCHAAQEYIGLKLKKIEEASRALADARKTAELAAPDRVTIASAIADAEKTAFVAPLIGGIARAAGGALGKLKPLAGKAMTALNHPATGIAAAVGPMVTAPKQTATQQPKD